MDDCSDQNGGCTDSCVDTPASYICRCPSGFALSDDSLSCKGNLLINKFNLFDLLIKVN